METIFLPIEYGSPDGRTFETIAISDRGNTYVAGFLRPLSKSISITKAQIKLPEVTCA